MLKTARIFILLVAALLLSLSDVQAPAYELRSADTCHEHESRLPACGTAVLRSSHKESAAASGLRGRNNSAAAFCLGSPNAALPRNLILPALAATAGILRV